MEQQIPLNFEASAGDTHKQVTTQLPSDVVQCLENARFLHLATCHNNIPNVALMNYTYLPSSPFSPSPVVIMTTNPSSRKTNNLVANPNVSLLVHDWVSHRPTTHPSSSRRMSGGNDTASDPHQHNGGSGRGVSPEAHRPSSLASLLFNLNTSAVSSISATISGTARLLDRGGEEEQFYRSRHLENNTFDDVSVSTAADGSAGRAQEQRPRGEAHQGDVPVATSANNRIRALEPEREDGGTGCFVAGEEVRVIVVDIKDVRTSDWKGEVRDWVIVPSDAQQQVNGLR